MKKLGFVFITMVLFSCNSKIEFEKPDDLIGKDTMILMLYDMHLAAGTSNLQNVHLEKNRNYMALVYNKYRIDSVRFANSNIYYTAKIDDYEEIFEEVQRRLKILEDETEAVTDSILGVNKNAREATRKKDSIEKALNLKK
ncbi:DUF4296 domain-containing protein [Lutimonas saemankumensis]|uniref:DUF4296 domain-containing protein n=1 Tax=Lutimonas saemankumensis TaxID=483016 RepID=UPI001CD658B9|nr:DUF4296 domain-containing protein [Lutimonas saemankumensis]MCA0932978.1 DUF4296 domain-containing protein [Lutimonas saemankumensis]